MELMSVDGEILFEGRFVTIRRAVEAAVKDGVDLSGVNLRGAMLRHACLEGASMEKACLWGARLDGAQMTGGYFTRADFRAAQMKEACLAESDCTYADFRGAYLPGLIVREGIFTKAQFSCPSTFSVPWEDAVRLDGAVYWHRGETPCPLSRRPVVVSGLARRVVVMDSHVLVGTDLFPLRAARS